MANEIFKEHQKFRHYELIAGLGFYVAALTWYYCTQNPHIVNTFTMPLSAYVSLVLPGFMLLIYFLMLRYSVSVTDKHISVRYFPGQQKKEKIKWNNIEKCEVLEKPRKNGWERFSLHHANLNEKTHSFSGKSGICVKTKCGKNIFIDVHQKERFKDAIRKIRPDIVE